MCDTIIFHPEDGRKIRIRDNSENETPDYYRVGDPVGWSLNPHEVGDEHLIDGVYYGWSTKKDANGKEVDAPAFVVLQGHYVRAVEDVVNDVEGLLEDHLFIPYRAQYERLVEQYGVPDSSPRPRSPRYQYLFTEHAWKRHLEAQDAHQRQVWQRAEY